MVGMVVNITLAFFFAWMFVLTFIVLKTKSHYERLTKHSSKVSLESLLDSLLHEAEKSKALDETLLKKITELQIAAQHAYRKIGMVQFHALGKTDGEKSFVIALLNEMNSGIVINFMYIPEGVRVYAKQVKDGKGTHHELSQEEKEAIAHAE